MQNYFDKSISRKYRYEIIFTQVRNIFTATCKCEKAGNDNFLKHTLFRWHNIENKYFPESILSDGEKLGEYIFAKFSFSMVRHQKCTFRKYTFLQNPYRFFFEK